MVGEGSALPFTVDPFGVKARAAGGRPYLSLREEMKFPSPDALREQVLREIARTRQFFRRLDVARSHRQTT